MSDRKYFCVISHTHWDREWYMPFEEFRVRLVELMDRLFNIIEKNPDYIFHLDAQTIVLEDYLQIRPWREATLRKYIKQGNILVGPWYLQNDFYLTSGEATIRNLLVGTKIANDFGKCAKAGYAPDQFGNMSQLPQILKQFNADNFIFGRGYGKYIKDENGNTVREKAPTEFIWEGADGTQVLAIHMRYWYNNAQRIYSDIDAAISLLGTIENLFDGFTATPYLLLMNGVDHLEAQDDLLQIIDGIKEKTDGKINIKQYNMEEYVEDVKNYIKANNIQLKTHKGELRDGHDWEILKGTLSSRIYLKQFNCKAQLDLEAKLEPLSSMYELAGAENSFDSDYLKYLWKQLLKNHPHDSICGCSRDEVHDHMEDNYEKLNEVTTYLTDKKCQDIANHVKINSKNPQDNILCLINSTSIIQSGIVKAELMFLEAENVEAFEITDIDGNHIDFEVIEKMDRKHDVFSPLNLPGVLNVRIFTILLKYENVKEFAVKGLLIRKTEVFRTNSEAIEKLEVNIIKSDYFGVSVSENGKIQIEFLKTGKIIENALMIEDLPDRGDAYVFLKSEDKPLLSTDYDFKTTVKHASKLRKSIKIDYSMLIPKEYDFANKKRSDDKIPMEVSIEITADEGSDVLKVETSFKNVAKDHRVRLLMDTGIVSNVSFADIPFDVIFRDITPQYPDTMSDVHPNTSFAGIKNQIDGVAILTCGTHEYEHLKDKQSILAFTICRANGFITMGNDYKSPVGPKWDIPGNQCLRQLKSVFGITEFSGDETKLPAKSLAFRAPVNAVFASCDSKKFSGGRFAIQGSSLAEFYYLPDLYPEIVIEDNEPIVGVKGDGIIVSALKKSENGKAFIIRLINMSNKQQELTIQYKGKIIKSNLPEDEIRELNSNDSTDIYTTEIRQKEIATFILD
ncbi:MAG: hypothetical protein K0S55_1642 [Clostridia bacterium]|nr:hypothetical protein [Clostridia bacterium]